jgi:primosomal protein N' (replication factor Y)
LAGPDKLVIRVALALPVKEAFDYSVPERLAPEARVGCRVVAPFGNRKVTGYILEVMPNADADDLKEIEEVLDSEPLFHADLVRFFSWSAAYYLSPIGKFIQSALPGGLNTSTFLCCEITPIGSKAVDLLGKDSEAGNGLAWIRDNPGKRILPGLKNIIPLLRKNGWITVGEKITRRRAGPLLKRFIRAWPGAELNAVLKDYSGELRTEAEREFLANVFRSGEISLQEIRRRFPRGDYLCRKWIRKNVLEICKRPVLRDMAGNVLCISAPPERLFEQQEKALNVIRGHLEKSRFSVCLLHGVTGSGKTEVYCGAIKKAVDMGRQAILMVPEIALSVYMEGIFRSRFGNRVAVYHSGLSAGERFDQWMRMARGDADIVIGARSALFSPFSNLGLIIVDEEHDTSYKQEESPRYHARDAAVARGKIEKVVVVLGSATPSVQSYHNAVTGKYHLLSMPERVESRPLPLIRIVDMKTLAGRDRKNPIVSPVLRNALAEHLAQGRQAMLFLNRRGFHRVHLCRYCGKSVRCPNCDLALIHHLRESRLACHYCGFRSDIRKTCPSCKKEGMILYGFGTEKLESEVREWYPAARVERMDRDSTSGKGETFQILKRFAEREVDFLVGTQMITKGYDFPNVTLVGVINADSTLGFPDFRAAERTFQLLSQVSGRAGRGIHEGEVVVQTFNPDHYAVVCAKDHDYLSFFERERQLREQLGYPPFSYMACLRMQGAGEKETEEVACRIGEGMQSILEKWPRRGKEVHVLGPAEAPIAKLKGRYRRQILVKCKGAGLLHYFLGEVEIMARRIMRTTGVSLTIDVDPYQML